VNVIIKEMKKRSHSTVFTPFYAALAPYTRALPLCIVDALRDLLGAEQSMANVRSASVDNGHHSSKKK
jgi:hypothetical protein